MRGRKAVTPELLPEPTALTKDFVCLFPGSLVTCQNFQGFKKKNITVKNTCYEQSDQLY